MTGIGSWWQGQAKHKTECTSESMCERKLWETAGYRHICNRGEVGRSYIAYTRTYKRVSGVAAQGVLDKYLID